MAQRIRSRIEAMPASSPAGITLFLTAVLGPIILFAVTMRLVAG